MKNSVNDDDDTIKVGWTGRNAWRVVDRAGHQHLNPDEVSQG